MIIPKSVTIGAERFDVVQRWKPFSPRVGRIDYKLRVITLNTATHRGMTRPQFLVAHTFWHEVVHGILHDMRRPELRDNEHFVDGVASRLNQLVNTVVLP